MRMWNGAASGDWRRLWTEGLRKEWGDVESGGEERAVLRVGGNIFSEVASYTVTADIGWKEICAADSVASMVLLQPVGGWGGGTERAS